jgi:hypothetical protein
MKNKAPKLLSALLAIIAVIMLYVGYTAPERASDAYSEELRDGAPHPDYSIKYLKQPFDDYVVVGAIQYCTGWMLLSAACIVFSLGLESKPKTI